MLERADYLDAARGLRRVRLAELRDARRAPPAHLEGRRGADRRRYLEDHAYLVDALLVLYEATFEQRWFDAARETADAMIERFADPERGGFFTTAADAEELIARRKDVDDHPIPSGNSAAAYALLRLAALTGEQQLRASTRSRSSASSAASPSSHPHAVAHLLRALDFHLSPTREVALVAPAGEDGLGELAAVVRSQLRPHLVLAGGAGGHDEPGADARAHRRGGPGRRLRVRALRLPPAR